MNRLLVLYRNHPGDSREFLTVLDFFKFPTVIFLLTAAYNRPMLKKTGGFLMDIDDLIYGDADPGPSSR